MLVDDRRAGEQELLVARFDVRASTLVSGAERVVLDERRRGLAATGSFEAVAIRRLVGVELRGVAVVGGLGVAEPDPPGVARGVDGLGARGADALPRPRELVVALDVRDDDRAPVVERVIHERARLSIMSSLATHPDGLLFNDLKDLCSLTDGNLSRHLQLLQESKLVEVWKGFKNNRPQTLVRLTDDGRKRFLEYVQELEQVVADAMAAAGRAAPARLPMSKGFSPA